MSQISVLIVDDSFFVRKALLRILEADPELEVAGTAGSGQEALEKIKALNPDVVTLDIMMPGMNGLETLGRIMESHPTPVLMLSQFTREGAELTLKALELGAMDFVDKSSAGIMDFFDLAREITSKIKSIAGCRPQKVIAPGAALSAAGTQGLVDIVAMGTSTGGPLALQSMLPKFHDDITFGIVIVQHMPKGFTGPLAKRLDTLCDIEVREAEEGDVIRPGTAYIAPAGLHMQVRRSQDKGLITLREEPADQLHKPSVDVLFESVAAGYGSRSIGVIMTGMGSDGARGLKAIRGKGGFTFAQDEATSAIFGMPRSAILNDAVDMVLPVTAIPGEILKRA